MYRATSGSLPYPNTAAASDGFGRRKSSRGVLRLSGTRYPDLGAVGLIERAAQPGTRSPQTGRSDSPTASPHGAERHRVGQYPALELDGDRHRGLDREYRAHHDPDADAQEAERLGIHPPALDAQADSSLQHSVLVESIAGTETLKSARAEGQMLGRWRRFSTMSAATQERMRQLTAVAVNLASVSQQIISVGLLIGGFYRFQMGEMTMGAIIAIITAAGPTNLAFLVYLLMPVINIGYVVGLLPTTGLPLPLISSGGSSVVTSMLVFGLLANFARHEPEAIAALRSLGPGRVGRLLRLPTPAPYRPPARRKTSRPVPRTRPGAKSSGASGTRRSGAEPRARGARSGPGSRAQTRGGHR